jgi:Protein of unknown function (DUF3631)
VTESPKRGSVRRALADELQRHKPELFHMPDDALWARAPVNSDGSRSVAPLAPPARVMAEWVAVVAQGVLGHPPSGTLVADTLKAMRGSARRDAATPEQRQAVHEATPPPPEAEPEDAEPEPEPLALALGEALNATVVFLRRYLWVTRPQGWAIALWAAHTHALDAAEDTPRLDIHSPEPESGKSRLLELLQALVARPRRWVLPSEAVLYRSVEKFSPTVLLDEVDAVFADRNASLHEGIRALINEGYHRGATVPRMVAVGDDFDVREFPVFAAVALAGLGRVPRTIATRSIPVAMQKKPRRVSLAPYRRPKAAPEGRRIGATLAARTAEVVEQLAEAEPEIPEGLSDRHADVWAPLLAIAGAAGGRWPARGASAARALCGAGQAAPDDSVGVQLLRDVRDVFDAAGADRLASAALCGALVLFDESPWADWYGRRPKAEERGVDPRALARLLRPYNIASHPLRFPGEKFRRGYEREQFSAAWEAHCPTASAEDDEGFPSNPDAPQASQRHNPDDKRDSDDSASVTPGARDGQPTPLDPDNHAGCDGVTDNERASWAEGHVHDHDEAFGERRRCTRCGKPWPGAGSVCDPCLDDDDHDREADR